MTEPTPEIEAGVPDGTPDDVDEPQTIEQARKLRSENRALRSRLHTAEDDLASAVTRLAAMEHAEVERIAGEHLVDASDIWRAQPDMQAYYDDEFKTIVGDKVVETAKALAAEKPHLARPQNAPPPTNRPIEGLRSGAAPEDKPPAPSWYTALRGG